MSGTPPPLPNAASKFKLAAYNLIGVAIAFGILISLNRGAFGGTYGFSYLTGLLISCILWPLLLGWVAYRIGRKSNTAGNVVFLIILILVVLGQIARRSPGTQPRSEVTTDFLVVYENRCQSGLLS